MAGSAASSSRSSVSHRVLVGALWLGVAVVTAVLVARRYIDATTATGFDLDWYYLPAARAVAEGGSPYGTDGYVYTPLIAMILAPIADAPWVAEAWKGLMVAAAAVACLLGVLASTPDDSSVRRPLVLGVAMLSVLYSWPMAHDFWYGQSNALVLLALTVAMLAHTRRHRRSVGLALGFGAVVKTWPAGLLLWLLRSPVLPRFREWQGVALAALLGLALTLSVGGLGAVSDLGAVTLRYSNQELVAYSAWGAGDHLFTDQAFAHPIVVSPVLARVVSWTLALALLGLLFLVLRRPGHPVIALPNLMFLLILLVPVAPLGYLVLATPTLWWWTARALDQPRNIRSWLAPAVLSVWWIVAMRVARATVDGTAAQVQYIAIMVLSLIAVTTSAVCASRFEPSARGPREDASCP